MRRGSLVRSLAAVALAAVSGCADEAGPTTDPNEDPTGEEPVEVFDDLKGDHAGSGATLAPTFQLVDPAQPMSTSARNKVRAALAVLADVAKRGGTTRQRTQAAETLARIVAGDVRIGAVASARGLDLWHMCKDLSDSAAATTCAGAPPSDPSWAGDDALRSALAAELDGYMWGDRLYFTLAAGTSATELASTLVHEVNHVLNRSECSYYADYFAHEVDSTAAWLEEYRAFVAECIHRRGTTARASRCDRWATDELVAREYGFTPDLEAIVGDDPRGTLAVAEALFADTGDFGWLVPTAARWPLDFGACE